MPPSVAYKNALWVALVAYLKLGGNAEGNFYVCSLTQNASLLRGVFLVQRKHQNFKCPYLKIAFSTKMIFTQNTADLLPQNHDSTCKIHPLIKKEKLLYVH